MIIKGYVSTGYIGSKREFDVEIDRVEWDAMSFLEQEEFMLQEMLSQIDWSYHVEGDDE